MIVFTHNFNQILETELKTKIKKNLTQKFKKYLISENKTAWANIIQIMAVLKKFYSKI